MRPVNSKYSDPLDTIWLSLASRFGLNICRCDHAYASSDGTGTLTIATRQQLDADDCLAQIILHELCHAICQGDASWQQVDWGLAIEGQQALLEEQTCLRLQHALACRYGLRHVLAPTTEHRAFYDGLGDESFSTDDTSVLARAALGRASSPPYFPHLDRALEQTGELARTVAQWTPDAGQSSETLLARVEEPAESGFDCAACGACCREAFDVVELEPSDAFVNLHAELCAVREGRIELRRPGGRCLALDVVEQRYTCRVYPTRPQTCRDFTRGSVNCREARQRVGLATYA